MLLGKLFNFLFHPNHTTKWLIVFWVNTSLLLYLTLMPSVQHHVTYQNIDKVFHFIGFGAFAFFCVLAFPRLAGFWSVIISFSLGIGVEITQSFLPHRAFSYADMLADFAGIIAAIGFLWVGKGVGKRIGRELRAEE